jgi:polysaccharide pyruvyl transferase WcaK-like protein
MIVLHGSYFGDNFGDSLFVIQYVEHLKSLGYTDDEIALPFAGQRVRTYVDVSPRRGVHTFLSAEKIVFFGGGYFGERKTQITTWHLRFLIRYGFIGMISRALGKKYIFLGVGAGPLKWGLTRAIVKAIVNGSEGFYARDEKSEKFLKGLGAKNVFRTTDSLIHWSKHRDLSNKDTKRILLHLPVKKEFESGLKKLISSIASVFDDSYEIVIANDFYKPSFESLSMHYARLHWSSVTYVEYSNPREFCNLINSCGFVFTVKLHVGILALSSGSKVFNTYMHEKSQRFYRQIGKEQYCFDFRKLDESTQKLVEAMATLRDDDNYSYDLPQEVLRLSKLNMSILKDFVGTSK